LIVLSFEYPKHVRYRCQRCALCCGDTKYKVRSILLLKDEAERISEKTSLEIAVFTEKKKGFEPYAYIMAKTKEGKCIFLNEDSCSIYEIRPLICRFYPFELKNPINKRYVFGYTNECIGIGKDLFLKRSFFESLFDLFKKYMKHNT
jgi:Fe-S-cluster containining protein